MSNSELSWADYRDHRVSTIVNDTLFVSLAPEPTIYAGDATLICSAAPIHFLK
jgi:hypothetical protein